MFFLVAVVLLQTAAFSLLMARELRTQRAVILSCSVLAIVGVVCTVLMMLIFEGVKAGAHPRWYCALSFGALALFTPLFALARGEKRADTE